MVFDVASPLGPQPGCDKPGRHSSGPGPSEVDFYHTEGYLIVRQLFDAREIADFAADVERVVIEHAEWIDPLNMRVRFASHHETAEPLFEVFDPISDLSPAADAMAHDSRILKRLHDLYGEPAELFKDKVIFKPAGASGHSLHQDWIAWPGFPESFLTVLVAIDAFTPENGATEVFPCCHRGGYLSERDGKHHHLDAGELPAGPVPLLLEPGDVAIFSCFTPHRSAANTSQTSRRGFFISYNSQSEGGQQHASHYRKYHEYIRARTPEDKQPRLYFR